MQSQRYDVQIRGRESRVFCVLLVLLVTIIGCHGYANASPRAYEYAKALYSICNRQADDKLAEVAGLIEADLTTGELSTREAKWLTAIVEDAKSGDWQTAMSEARKLMEDQTQRTR